MHMQFHMDAYMGGPPCDRSGSPLSKLILFHTWMLACLVPRFRMNSACWTGYLSVWRSPTPFRLPNKNSPLTPYARGQIALLKSDNYHHLGKFLSTLVSFFLPLHFRLFFMRSSTSFLFTQFPCTAAKTSWRDVQIMIINVGFSVFFFFLQRRSVGLLGRRHSDPLLTHPKQSISFSFHYCLYVCFC